MRIAYGEGVIVSLLLPFVLLFLKMINLERTIFLVILLLGVWTIVSALFLVGTEEQRVYATWGLILACASSFFVISATYAVALVLIAVISSVFIFMTGRNSRAKSELR